MNKHDWLNHIKPNESYWTSAVAKKNKTTIINIRILSIYFVFILNRTSDYNTPRFSFSRRIN